MQEPGGTWEDPTKGFKFGGWAMLCFDQEFGEEIDRVFNEKLDLLLGRKTYEIFAGSPGCWATPIAMTTMGRTTPGG